jgi:hypothetical protein
MTLAAFVEVTQKRNRAFRDHYGVGEARDGSLKAAPPNVIVAAGIIPGTVIVPEEGDDAQLTLITAISAFGDSRISTFISTNKAFEKVSLAAQQLFEGHNYTIDTAKNIHY